MHSRISVVIPLYNERENLDALLARITPVMDRLSSYRFEVLFVDDGSQDGSSALLDGWCARDARFKAIHLSRNFGHQPAMQAGLDSATGDAVVTMDGDLQDPPELIGELIAKWKEGYDVVYGIRKRRNESAWKRLAIKCFSKTLNIMAHIGPPLDAGDFALIDRRVVDQLVALRERNRFIRGLRSWLGFRQTGIEYDRGARNAGMPKQTLRKLLIFAFAGYFGFSSLPLHLAAWLGLASTGLGFALFVWVIVSKLTGTEVPQPWGSSTALTLFMGGIQLTMLGVIGEYLRRVYDEVRQRPLYVVQSQTEIADEARSKARGLQGADSSPFNSPPGEVPDHRRASTD
jgi:dolichol-phosphate mannosyltransferase